MKVPDRPGISLLLVAAVVATPAFAETYQPYSCPTAPDATACSSKCAKGSISYEFLVNPSTSTILLKHLDGRKVLDTFALDNCKVADIENWICGVTRYGPGGFEIKQAMSAGRYFVSEITPDGSRPNEYRCAKKKGLFGLFD